MEQSDKEWANPEAAQKDPAQNAATLDLENERKQANKYVIISLCCRYAPTILASLLGMFSYSIKGISETAGNSLDALTGLCSLLTGSGYLASWVFAIVARTKFKSAKSPKVLIIVYLVLLGLEILATVLLFMFFLAIIQSCSGAAW